MSDRGKFVSKGRSQSHATDDRLRERIAAHSRATGSAGPPRDEARRIAVNIAKMPELLKR